MQEDLLDRTREIANSIRERAAEYDRDGEFPIADVEELMAAGIYRVPVPSEYGGYASRALFCGTLPTRIVYEVARASAGTAWVLLSHFHACGQIAGVATEEQKRRIFAEVVEGSKRIATIGSEVNVQVNPASEDSIGLESTGTAVNEDLVVSGFKGFTSTAAYADYIVYWHLQEGSRDPSSGTIFSLVPRNREGIEFLPGWEHAMGIRSSASGPAKFSDVVIRHDEVLGEPGAWVQHHPYTHEILYAAVLTGIARECYEQVRLAVHPRKDMWRDRVVMDMLGSMSSEVQAAEWGLERAAEMWERAATFEEYGEAHHATIRTLHIAKRAAIEVTTRAFELVGTRAVTRKAPFERFWRDARVASLHNREWQHMEWVARGDLTGYRFSKEKYGDCLDPAHAAPAE